MTDHADLPNGGRGIVPSDVPGETFYVLAAKADEAMTQALTSSYTILGPPVEPPKPLPCCGSWNGRHLGGCDPELYRTEGI